MEANGLMIGDYFYRPDCFDRVIEIHKNGVIGSDPLRGLIPWSEIKPITLTTEILEKNRFKGEGYLILELDKFSYLEYYPFEGRLRKIWHGIDEWNNHSDTKDITFQCTCKYVHELQQALRLCGLDKLANDLKMEE